MTNGWRPARRGRGRGAPGNGGGAGLGPGPGMAECSRAPGPGMAERGRAGGAAGPFSAPALPSPGTPGQHRPATAGAPSGAESALGMTILVGCGADGSGRSCSCNFECFFIIGDHGWSGLC